MPLITLAGGGEPPVWMSTTWSKLAPLLGRRADQHVEHGRRAAHMRHAVLDDHREDQRRIDLAQADMRAAHRDHRPREAPAVAVEHRQRPQIDRLRRQRPRHDVADRFQERAAVVIDHALRIAGGARGVVERDRAALVGWRRPREVRIAAGDEVLVLDLAEPLARPGVERIVDVDHQRRLLQLRERRADLRGEFAVGDQHLGLAMLEDIGDGRRHRAAC